jgi:hypothetical protein
MRSGTETCNAIGLVEQDTNSVVASFMQRWTQTQILYGMDWQISV